MSLLLPPGGRAGWWLDLGLGLIQLDAAGVEQGMLLSQVLFAQRSVAGPTR